jgi:MFS family permease
LLIASVGELAMVAPIWLLVTDVPAGAIIAAMAVSGLANGIANPPVHAIFTLRTPRALRAKVWSVVIAATAVLAPVALAAAGVVLETDGFRPVIFMLVAVQSVAAIAFTAAGLRERARVGQAVAA